MRCQWVTLLLCFLLSSVGAVTLTLPRLPSTTHADGEVSADRSLPKLDGEFNRFRLVFSVHATPTNNIEIAFGRDCEPADGLLAAEETSFIIGWDSGSWHLRLPGLRETLLHTPTDSGVARRRILTLLLHLDSAGEFRDVAITDDTESPLFPALEAAAWLPLADCDLLRLTRRGSDLAHEEVRVATFPDGLIMLLK